MKLLTKILRRKLEANYKEMVGAQEEGANEPDHEPIVKFFVPWGAGTWLITEILPDNRMFGLCDLGLGFPELGYVQLEELEGIRGPGGLKIERDRHWKSRGKLSEYDRVAQSNRRFYRTEGEIKWITLMWYSKDLRQALTAHVL